MKEELKKAFEAGINYRDNCSCGDCPVDPDFEEWFEQQSTKAPEKVVTDEQMHDSANRYVQYRFECSSSRHLFDQTGCYEHYSEGAKWMRKQLTGL